MFSKQFKTFSITIVMESNKRGRKAIYDEGYRQHMIDSKYHLNYYHENKHIRINCPRCNKDVCKITISLHMKTKKCMRLNTA